MNSSKWTAETGNDPEQDFDLIVELLEDGEYRGRVRRSPAGGLELQIYPGEGFSVPADWLEMVLSSSRKDVWPESSVSDTLDRKSER